MATKRKRNYLTLSDKFRLIEAVEKGITQRQAAEQFGVGQATVCGLLIKKKAEMTGSEKLKPLVIGQSKNLSCFKKGDRYFHHSAFS